MIGGMTTPFADQVRSRSHAFRLIGAASIPAASAAFLANVQDAGATTCTWRGAVHRPRPPRWPAPRTPLKNRGVVPVVLLALLLVGCSRNLYKENHANEAAVALIERLGAGIGCLRVEIMPTQFLIVVADPERQNGVHRWWYSNGEVHGPQKASLLGRGDDLKASLFRLADIDFRQIPEIVERARARAKRDVTLLELKWIGAARPEIQWSVNFKGGKHAFVTRDGKQVWGYGN
jgi:hypothetical protein